MSVNYSLQTPNLKKNDNEFELEFTSDRNVDRKSTFAEYYSALRADLKKNHNNSKLVVVVRAGVFAYLIIDSDVICFHDSQTPESTVNAISQGVPQECIKSIVIIVDYDDTELRRRSVETLHDAGYHNIETIDERCFDLSSSSFEFDCRIGKLVFINFLLEYKDSFVNYPLHVLKKCEDGWELIDTLPTPTIALSKYPSTRHVVIFKGATEAIHKEVKALFPNQELHLLGAYMFTAYEMQFVTYRAYHAYLEIAAVFPLCYVDLFVQFGDKSETISLNKRMIPFTFTKEVDIGDTSVVTVVKITETGNSLDAALSQLKLDPSPKTVLTFTSDNRLLIEASKTYTGDKEILAYVRLQSGKSSEVGQHASTALKTHPGFVFYDITRLLATDFDPDHPDPSWNFKTTRDVDGKVLVHGDDGITTHPIVLFGLVVNSTLLYIKEHIQSEVSELGIRLPVGSAISDDELKSVSDRIGVELKML
uniref:Ubiquitin-like domain-containing protein n=1 Tax=Panagrellus redivivus TaxID=6233 RepID=A0A7E4UT58_PANRE